MRAIDHAPLSSLGLQRMKDPRERQQDVVCRFEIVMQCHRQIERDYSAQNTCAKNSMSPNVHAKVFTCSNLFCVLVVGRENHENLDLAKISRYMVLDLEQTVISQDHDWYC